MKTQIRLLWKVDNWQMTTDKLQLIIINLQVTTDKWHLTSDNRQVTTDKCSRCDFIDAIEFNKEVNKLIDWGQFKQILKKNIDRGVLLGTIGKLIEAI